MYTVSTQCMNREFFSPSFVLCFFPSSVILVTREKEKTQWQTGPNSPRNSSLNASTVPSTSSDSDPSAPHGAPPSPPDPSCACRAVSPSFRATESRTPHGASTSPGAPYSSSGPPMLVPKHPPIHPGSSRLKRSIPVECAC